MNSSQIILLAVFALYAIWRLVTLWSSWCLAHSQREWTRQAIWMIHHSAGPDDGGMPLDGMRKSLEMLDEPVLDGWRLLGEIVVTVLLFAFLYWMLG